jgi:hypothetical protein
MSRIGYGFITLSDISDGIAGARNAVRYLYYTSQTDDVPSSPSATITWSTGALSAITTDWSETPPVVDATGTDRPWVSTVTFHQASSSSQVDTTTATGTTPKKGFTFDGVVTFTNNDLTDGSTTYNPATVVNAGTTTIDGGKITANSITSLGSVTAGTFSLGSGKFAVDSSGKLSATDANISGDITANNLNVTNATVTGDLIATGLVGFPNVESTNMTQSLRNAIEEIIVSKFGSDASTGYYADATGTFGLNDDNAEICKVTGFVHNGSNVDIDVTFSRSWLASAAGIPSVVVNIQRKLSTDTTWTTIKTQTVTGTSTQEPETGDYFAGITGVVSANDNPDQGTYDYRFLTGNVLNTSTISITARLEANEQGEQIGTIDLANYAALAQDETITGDWTFSGTTSGISYDNLDNKPTLITQTDIDNSISALVDSAPATLDTLNELAAALGDNANFAQTTATALGTKWTQDNTKISNWDDAYEAQHSWEWRWQRWAGTVQPPVDSTDAWQTYYETYFAKRTSTIDSAHPFQDGGYLNTIDDVDSTGGFGGSTYGNMFGNLSTYHCLIYTNIYVDKEFTVNITNFSGDDPHAIFVDGKFVHGRIPCCTDTAYSYTFTQGWHRIDLIYSEGGGGDWIRMGWNPKDYTANISDMVAHRGSDNPIYLSDKINAVNNSANWDAAYGWGDHSTQGYLTSLPSHTHDYLPLSGGTLTGGLSISGYNTISSYAGSFANLSLSGGLTVSNVSTIDAARNAGFANLSYSGSLSNGSIKQEWTTNYVLNSTTPKELLYSNGQSLPNGGVYRFSAHISGTGTDNWATAVYWNQNGTWKLNVTQQSGVSSNNPEFVISNDVPTLVIDHSNNYTVHVFSERLELNEDGGTDNNGGFGADAFLSNVGGSLRYNPYGSGVNYATGDKVFTDGYHPNADKWTTAKALTLTGDVSGTVTWDGSANASITTAVANDSHSHSNYIASNANDSYSGNITATADDWYLWSLGARGASGGEYGIGNRNDNSFRQLTFHVPNRAAYANSGVIPSFGWYSNGAVELMKLTSNDGNLSVKGGYQINGTTVVDSSRNLTNINTITASGLIKGNQLASNYWVTKQLSGTQMGNSYNERVILLCPKIETNTSHNNIVDGKITMLKTGGNVCDSFEVFCHSVYNDTRATFTSRGQRTAHKFVTCTYGGIKWVAIKFDYTNNPYNYALFQGQAFTNVSGHGDNQLKIISYYDTLNGGSVLNSEVYNSIADYNPDNTYTVFENGSTTFNSPVYGKSNIRSYYSSTNYAQLESNISGGVLKLEGSGTTLLRSYGISEFPNGVGIGTTTVIDSSRNATFATLSTSGNASVSGALKITETGTTQVLMMGNQDSGGSNKPAMIMGVNGYLRFGYGNTWSGEGGTFTEILRVDSNTDIKSGDLKVNGTTVIDSSRNFSGKDGSFSEDVYVNTSNGNNYLRINKGTGNDGGVLFEVADSLKWQNVQRDDGGLQWYSYGRGGTNVIFPSLGGIELYAGDLELYAGDYKIGTTTVIDSSRNMYPNIIDMGSGNAQGYKFHGRSFSWNSSMQSPTTTMPHIWQESYSGWDPILGIKTTNGFWQMGAYSSNRIHFGYMAGAYGGHSTNAFDTSIAISPTQFKVGDVGTMSIVASGDISAASNLQINGTTVIDSSRNISGVNLDLNGRATIWTNDDNALVLRQGQAGHPWNYIEFKNSANERNWYTGTDPNGNYVMVGETGATGVYTNKRLTAEGLTSNGVAVIDSDHNNTRLQLRYHHSGVEDHIYSGHLTLWTSEPGITYDNCGIGGNINVGGQHYGRQINSNAYGVYLRFDVNEGFSEFWSTTGSAGTAGGKGGRRWYVDASGNTNQTGNIDSTGRLRVSGGNNSDGNSQTSTGAVIGTYVDQYAFIDLASSNASGSWIDFSYADGGDYKGRIRYTNSGNYFQISANGTETVRLGSNIDAVSGGFRIGTTTVIDSSRNATFASTTTGLIEMNQTSTSGYFGAASFSWGGVTTYPTLYGENSDRWVMICFPHIPYMQNGSRGFTGTTRGAVTRYEGDINTTTYWDAGVKANIGANTYSISLNNADWVLNINSSDRQVNAKYGLKVDGTTVIDSSRNLTNIRYVTAERLYVGDGNDGFFYSDTNGRTAFAGGHFYIQNSVTSYYNYATNQYHGDSSGDNHYFRSNYVGGTNWNFDTSGNLTALSYKVSGTTVIDSSRNLTNIGTVSTSSTITCGGEVNASGDIYAGGGQVYVNSGNADVKLGLWGNNSTTYGIGMTSGVTYGGLNDYAMTFCMNNESDRGFWWGYSGQSKSSGAMSLTTAGVLTVASSITAGGNITAYSDARLKDNVKTLDGSKVYEMRGVSFTKDGELGSGVIAQELEQVAPELVMTNDDEMQTKSVAYGNVVGYLIEAIKELKQEIEVLKNGTNSN